MKIGIIVAMDKELQLLCPMLDNRMTVTIDDTLFNCGRMAKHDIVVFQCGIGKVNAAVGVMTLVSNFDLDLIINTGVAGAADASVSEMDIVVGNRITYHDVWCGPETEMGAVQGLPRFYEAPAHVVAKIPKRKDIKKGLIASGDYFVDSLEKLNEIKANFPDALAVDMESGAIAQVCYLKHLPFMSMRVISDSPVAGHDNTAEYNDFWSEAPVHTFEVLKHIVESL